MQQFVLYSLLREVENREINLLFSNKLHFSMSSWVQTARRWVLFWNQKIWNLQSRWKKFRDHFGWSHFTTGTVWNVKQWVDMQDLHKKMRYKNEPMKGPIGWYYIHIACFCTKICWNKRSPCLSLAMCTISVLV